jgi:hypothetical protein
MTDRLLFVDAVGHWWSLDIQPSGRSFRPAKAIGQISLETLWSNGPTVHFDPLKSPLNPGAMFVEERTNCRPVGPPEREGVA